MGLFDLFSGVAGARRKRAAREIKTVVQVVPMKVQMKSLELASTHLKSLEHLIKNLPL